MCKNLHPFEVPNSRSFVDVLTLWNQHHHHSELFCPSQKWPLAPLQSIHPHSQATTDLLSVSVDQLAWSSRDSYSMYPFVSGFFDSADQYWVGSMFYVSAVCSFLLLSSIPLYGYCFFKKSVYLLLDIWIVSRLGLLQVKLLWIFLYKPLCEHLFWFLLNKYLGGKCLDHMVDVHLIIKEIVFQSSCIILRCHQ